MIIAFLRTSFGTLLSMFVITTAGYALSKEFRGRTPLMWFFVFTMLFGGGLIPSYMVNVSLGLKNNFLVYILPGAFGCYNLILIMNFFKSIPKSLEEAALIDGASFFTVLRKIYLPLSKAGLATVALFIMVGYWNEWFTGILYMSDTKNYPLASFLQEGCQRIVFRIGHVKDSGEPLVPVTNHDEQCYGCETCFGERKVNLSKYGKEARSVDQCRLFEGFRNRLEEVHDQNQVVASERSRKNVNQEVVFQS